MAELEENHQNDSASEDQRQEVDEDEKEKDEKIKPEDKRSPIPVIDVQNLRTVMINQNTAKKNRQLHRLFLINRYDECLLIIDVSL